MIQQALAARQLPSNWSGFNLPNPILILLLAGAIGLDLLQNRSKREDFLLFWPRFWQMLFILVLLGISLLAFFSDSAAPFVYQGF